MKKKITRKNYHRILINRKIKTDKGNQLTRGNNYHCLQVIESWKSKEQRSKFAHGKMES